VTISKNLIPRQAAGTLEQLARQCPLGHRHGPGQAGKTTLVRSLFGQLPYASLEESDRRAFAVEDPRGFLAAGKRRNSGFPESEEGSGFLRPRACVRPAPCGQTLRWRARLPGPARPDRVARPSRTSGRVKPSLTPHPRAPTRSRASRCRPCAGSPHLPSLLTGRLRSAATKAVQVRRLVGRPCLCFATL
jgi:hypothetical protein